MWGGLFRSTHAIHSPTRQKDRRSSTLSKTLAGPGVNVDRGTERGWHAVADNAHWRVLGHGLPQPARYFRPG